MFWLGLYFACMPFTYLFCKWRIQQYAVKHDSKALWTLKDRIGTLVLQLIWPFVVLMVAFTTDWINWEKPVKW